MTTAATTHEQRGAGSGENAIRQRSKKNKDEVEDPRTFPEGKSAKDYQPDGYEEGKEYPEGEAAAGKIDFEEKAKQQNLAAEHMIPMRDRRAYLKDQAEKNEAANDELQARQVERANELTNATALIEDPDWQRDTSMESAIADDEMHTPEGRDKRLQTRQAIQQARIERGDTSPVPGDVSGGKGNGGAAKKPATPPPHTQTAANHKDAK